MKRFLALTVITAVMFLGAGFAAADTIQFPYVNSNPGNLSTLISVINVASVTDIDTCEKSDTLRLHFTYMTKSVDAAHTAACDELDFDRPTTPYDIVTFDFAGNINGGLAMFNDATSYAAGVGNPNFDLPTLGTSEPRRGYVLVNHRCLAGGDRPSDYPFSLSGEAMLFDVVNGAAWNYEAIDANHFRVNGGYSFADLTDGYAYWGGGSFELLSENAPYSGVRMPIIPPSDLTTRMLVTPQVISSNNGETTDMSIVSGPGQKRTRIAFRGRGNGFGMTNRNEDAVSGGGPVHVRCVAGIDISEILGLAATTIQNEGGWAMVDLLDPTPLSGVDTAINPVDDLDHAAIVFKLEFGAPTWSAGSMINAARLIKSITSECELGC